MTATFPLQAQRFSRSDYKTLGLAALGGALEIYDFIIFVFFALTLSQLFFPPEMPEWLRLLQSFGIFVTGYLARPLGGILMAHFADHLGRKRVFSLSILMMALPCLLIGIMPTYAHIGYFAPLILLALRVLQGAAVGGEVPSAWTFVAEHAPAPHRGYALGFLQAGLTFGYLLGALTATLLAQVFTPAEILDYAWRFPFLLGGVFGVIGVWLRRWLNETPVFLEMQARRQAAAELPLRTVLRDHRAVLLPAMILTCVLTSAVVVLVVITPHHDAKNLRHEPQPHLRLERLGHRVPEYRLRTGRPAGRPHRRLARGAGLQPAIAGRDWHSVRQLDQRRRLAGRGVCRRRLELRRGGRGAVGDGRPVSGAGAGVGDFLYLQHCLRAVGKYDAVDVDCTDADQPVDLRDLLRGDGGGGRGECGAVW